MASGRIRVEKIRCDRGDSLEGGRVSPVRAVRLGGLHRLNGPFRLIAFPAISVYNQSKQCLFAVRETAMDESTHLSAVSTSSDGAPGQAARSPEQGSGRLFTLLVFLAIAAVAPYLVGQIVYQIRFNELKADVDVATGALEGLKPDLTDFELASRLVAKRVEPSVVSIFRPGFRGRDGQGSGVIVDTAGYIITNYHVVSGASSIQVQLTDGRRTAGDSRRRRRHDRPRRA